MTAEAPSASVRYTLDFVRAALGDGASRVLEIGCGTGELAQLLMGQGLDIHAIDQDADAVAEACARGVKAECMRWPQELDCRYDAVLFTRSLHHIEDLAGAVSAARDALLPGGRVIVEDFRAEGGSARSAAWYLGIVELLIASGVAIGDLEALASKLDVSHDAHHLHSSGAIASALSAEFVLTAEDAAYYFRYLEPSLPDRQCTEALLRHEIGLMRSGCIDPLGKRFVGVSEGGSSDATGTG